MHGASRVDLIYNIWCIVHSINVGKTVSLFIMTGSLLRHRTPVTCDKSEFTLFEMFKSKHGLKHQQEYISSECIDIAEIFVSA